MRTTDLYTEGKSISGQDIDAVSLVGRQLLKTKLQNILAQNLTDLFEDDKLIPNKELRKYYIAGYLLKEDYLSLMESFYNT